MPAYNFQSQFAPMIRDGVKKQTIRRRRKKNPTKPGQTLWLYTGMRTKACRLVGDSVCMDVKPVQIYPQRMEVVLDGKALDLDETVTFVKADGFANPMLFFHFFERYPAEVLENELEVIYWR